MKISFHLLTAFTAFALVACGNNASMSSAPMEDESEIAPTGEELVSNRADVWWPMQEGNSWTLKSATDGALRTVPFSGVGQGMAWMDGVITDGSWVGTSTSAINTLYSWDETTASW